MLPISVNRQSVVGAAANITELFRGAGIEEYSQVPANETWVIDFVAVEMTANPGSWVLKTAGRELANGYDIVVAALGALDLNLVPRLNLTIPGGTKLVWNHTDAGTTLICRVRIQGKRFVRGA